MSRRVLVGFGSISLNRVWFMRRLNLLPILPISTAKQNITLNNLVFCLYSVAVTLVFCLR